MELFAENENFNLNENLNDYQKIPVDSLLENDSLQNPNILGIVDCAIQYLQRNKKPYLFFYFKRKFLIFYFNSFHHIGHSDLLVSIECQLNVLGDVGDKK